MSAAAEPRRLRADAARNRQALIDAAERLFTARGLSVTLDDVAAEAGLNVATAYRHFANKHELIEVFVRRNIDAAAVIAERAAGHADPEQGLRDFFTGTLDLIVASRGLHDILTPGYADRWLEELDVRIEPLARRLIARAQQSGAVRAGIEPGDLGAMLQMLTGISDMPSADPGTMLQRYLELLLAGLRADAGPLPGTPPSPRQARESLQHELESLGSARRRRRA